MTSASLRLFTAGLLACLILSACRCGSQLDPKAPEIELDTVTLDFGRVELEYEHVQSLLVTNRGTVPLNVTELRVEAPFGVKTAVPFSIQPDDTVEIEVTFFATRADVRETATLIVVSDDPERFEVPVALAGTGVKGQARVMPSTLDFGDVYVGDPKAVTLTMTNLGSAPLRPQQVLVPMIDGFTGDVAPLLERVPAGASASVTFTFRPPVMGAVSGELVIELPEDQGGAVSVPVRGRGISALPQLCVESPPGGPEVCTPVNASSANGLGNLFVSLPPRCDIQVFPPDAGAGACDEDSATARARFRIKNAGNTPVSYTVTYDRALTPNACGLATPPPPDFGFSNAPMTLDGGFARTWTEPTTSLPLMASAPPPFESAPVEIAYRATSFCPDDTSDQARIVFTRQGMSGREPSILTAVLQGSSSLPRLQGVNFSCEASGGPCSGQIRGVMNFGTAPAEITDVHVYQLRGPDNVTFLCDAKLDAGSLEECPLDESDLANDNCSHFRWTLDGGNPAPRLPITVDAGTSGTPTFGRIGALEFAYDGFACMGSGVCQGQTYCLYGVLDTTDPYNQQIVIQLKGIAN